MVTATNGWAGLRRHRPQGGDSDCENYVVATARCGAIKHLGAVNLDNVWI